MASSRPCNAATRRGRLRKARGFLAAATTLQAGAETSSDQVDAFVTLCVHAGIAAADVICCALLGLHASGESHHDAVELLRRADSKNASDLRVLLGLKTKSGYSAESATSIDALRARRAATRLVERAEAV